jgi:hypothetical protein
VRRRRKITLEAVTRARKHAVALVLLLETVERGMQEDNREGVRLCLREARLAVYDVQRELNAGMP